MTLKLFIIPPAAGVAYVQYTHIYLFQQLACDEGAFIKPHFLAFFLYMLLLTTFRVPRKLIFCIQTYFKLTRRSLSDGVLIYT